MRNTTRLRELLAGPEMLVAPGAYDALSARLIAQAGFPAVYMTGFGTAASVLGQPDVGLLTMSEMVGRASALASVIGDIPLIADADTGYGNPINVQRTMREYERAGVAALHIEDQIWPKNVDTWKANRSSLWMRWCRKYVPLLMLARTPTS